MNPKAMLKWQRRMRKNPCRSQAQKHQSGNDGSRALHSVRHESAQSPPQGQQYHRKHNRKRRQTANEREKEALRSVVAELKRRREDTSNRMENGGNQDGDDKSSHDKSGLTLRALRRPRAATIASGALCPSLLESMVRCGDC